MKEKFWEQKTLSKFSQQEWEALCDGCGQCCLVKLEDEDTGEVVNTNVACRLLNLDSCRCKDYENRLQKVPVCIHLSLENLETFDWLPSSCAYRRLLDGKSIPEWHPLLTKDADSVREAGYSVCEFAQSEEFIHPDQLHDHIIEI